MLFLFEHSQKRKDRAEMFLKTAYTRSIVTDFTTTSFFGLS
jgi:hypothetical protein